MHVKETQQGKQPSIDRGLCLLEVRILLDEDLPWAFVPIFLVLAAKFLIYPNIGICSGAVYLHTAMYVSKSSSQVKPCSPVQAQLANSPSTTRLVSNCPSPVLSE